MGAMSKHKGASFERQIANIFKDRGFKARRSAQYCGNSGEAADVIGVDGIHIECKAQERMHLYDWMAQAERDANGSGNIPVVIHKQNRKPILVTMKLDDWLDMFEREGME